MSTSDLAMPFVENGGQLDPRAHFSLTQGGTSTFFTDRGLAISLADQDGTSQRWGLRLDFLGADRVVPEARHRNEAVVGYFHGDVDEWQTGIRTSSSLIYRDVWPGIDLRYGSTSGALKYSFIVHPGGDPSDIRLGWRGATRLQLEGGRLQVRTPAGSLEDDRPVSYQATDGSRAPVASAFELDGETYGFRVGDYDRSRPLVIDPAITYAGFVGGDLLDEARAIEVDSSGAAYLVGSTESPETTFPVTVGPDTTFNMIEDAFIAKVNPAGTGLVYAGYIGGDQYESAFGVAVDPSGAAYVVGSTESDDTTFPDIVGPDTSYNEGGDAFVAKVNPSGTALDYAGFIGGDQFDRGEGVAIDGSGAAYVSGYAESDQTTFPVAVGPDTTYNEPGPDASNDGDAFVAKVTPSGQTLSYAGYIGGDMFDESNGIRVDSTGAAYVGGRTRSAQDTFPETVGPDLTFNEPGVDASNNGDGFAAKVNPAGSALVYAGYVGGDQREDLRGVALLGDTFFLSGETDSDQSTFPVVVGPDLTHNSPGTERDAFVAKVNSAGTGLAYSGFIGGADEDAGRGIDVDPTGAAYVTGRTSSDQASFPVIDPPEATYSGNTDAFVAKVNPAGSGLVYSGYIGGDDFDKGYGLALDQGANVYIGGRTDSSEATFPEVVGPDLTYNGGSQDAFVAKLATTERCKGKPVTHLGSEGNDTITGSSGSDVVLAGGGNDVVKTLGGADTVCAGAGNDKANGGGGRDLLLGEKGNDKLKGGGGAKDRSVGGPGKDKLTGGGGKKDKCKGGPGKDRGGAGCEGGRI